MTDSNTNPVHGEDMRSTPVDHRAEARAAEIAALRKERFRALNFIILCAMLFGLLMMFGGSFIYRLGQPSLVKTVRVSEAAPQQQSFGGEKDGQPVPPEVMRHITDLMGKLKDDPESYTLRIELAEHFIEISNWKSAIPHLEKALSLKPDAMQPYNYLGYSHFSLGEHEAAAKYYSESARRFNDANAKLNLAFIFKNHLNRQAEADKLFDEVIADPDTSEELRGIARSLKAGEKE